MIAESASLWIIFPLVNKIVEREESVYDIILNRQVNQNKIHFKPEIEGNKEIRIQDTLEPFALM